jgi:hypothetical protein
VTGTGALSVPIAAPDGRAGFRPDLTLGYDSGAGNGPFGLGWQLAIPSVRRKTDRGLPQYRDDVDVYIVSGSEDLVPLLVDSGGLWSAEVNEVAGERVASYRPRVEGSFARVQKHTVLATGEVYWTATTRGNVTSVFGRSVSARVADPADARRVFEWKLEQTSDDRGNVVSYQYKLEDGQNVAPGVWEASRRDGRAPVTQSYPKRVLYGNVNPGDASTGVFEVVFDYGEHDLVAPTPDETAPWVARSDAFSSYRARFEVRTHRLCRRVLVFHRFAELGATPCLVRSTELTFSESPIATTVTSVTQRGWMRAADGSYTTRTLPQLDLQYSAAVLHDTAQSFDAASLAGVPLGALGRTHDWVDLDGEGIPGLLLRDGRAFYYKRNLGAATLAPPQALATTPAADGTGHLADIDADGAKELVTFDRPLAGYQDRTDDGWAGFQPFRGLPDVDLTDSNVRFVDLTGDGLEDVFLATDSGYVLYPSLGKDGYAPPRRTRRSSDDDRAPSFFFDDGTQSVFLADMSGDGLLDLVRIRQGSVVYWPNLGYGRFGAKIVMGSAPRFDAQDLFDPRRIRLADVDGSGTTDILYFGTRGAVVWMNQSGNSFAPPVTLRGLAPALFDDQTNIAVVDVMGSGTPCIVLSSALPGSESAPVLYVDLMGGVKPYLLTRIDDNQGAQTTLTYAPSTQFYLADRAAGRPWVTKLPFPVQVLTRSETYDAVAETRAVTTYAYHHGYYDGVEREFRGFGMVEQWDAESFSSAVGSGAMPPDLVTSEPELHRPPVHSKTWFHTGAWMAEPSALRQFAHEYWSGDPQAPSLADTAFPAGLTSADTREAARALKGRVLREEIYADDGTPLAGLPYRVVEHSYAVVPLQPVAGATHGAFFVHAREDLELHYERDPADPRAVHTLTLAVDAYGSVLQSAAIAYPRRQPPVDAPEQAALSVTLIATTYVNVADDPTFYRLGVAVEAFQYEVTGLPATTAPFAFDAVLGWTAAPIVPYESAPAPPTVQRRELAHRQVDFWTEDLTGVMPFGQINSRALVRGAYDKALTPGLVAVLGGRLTDAILAEGGYVRRAGDDGWWGPSPRVLPSAALFYQPSAYLDALGNQTTLRYDAPYALQLVGSTDPLGNVNEAQIDYRTLQPSLVTDPNLNRTAYRYDELAVTVASAVLGKASAPEGDTLDDPTVKYDYAFGTGGAPTWVRTRARETHGDPATRWVESTAAAGWR